jgi:glycosyltransferase involved in cell wall biosynthesis
MASLPVICVFGAKNVELLSAECPSFETRDMDVKCYSTDENLYEVLACDRPSCIVSFGDMRNFTRLASSPDFVLKMWIHFEDMNDLVKKGRQVFDCFIMNAISKIDRKPLVSVFTPAFRSGDKILKPFMSLLGQTYKDWEWVIVDDSDDNGETFKMLSEMAEKDGRIRVYKEHKHSGRIGTVKRTACGIARGQYLVVLDHDDELTMDALKLIVDAFIQNPESGFVYTDFAECLEDGSMVTYPDGWGLGYGAYRQETHGGVKYMVVNSPNINPKTIRHIVAAPNHIRAWKKSFYDSIGGHSDMMHVVDDYELMVRTFLSTRMVHIPKLCYIQYRNMDGSGNTHKSRNKEIQRLVRYVSMNYDDAIHNRFLSLGIDDYLWSPSYGQSFINMCNVPNPDIEQHCTIKYGENK